MTMAEWFNELKRQVSCLEQAYTDINDALIEHHKGQIEYILTLIK